MREFYIVDVFAEEKYAGNQLAVVRGTDGLTTEDMQAIALEMNYSETTFIVSDEMRDGGYDVRIFTTVSELPFAGHPTLGTAFILNQFVAPEPSDRVILNLGVGQIPVTTGDVLWMKQKSPQFGATFDYAAIADSLGISVDDMDTRFPVQTASTGLPFIIAPLKSLDAVKRAEVNLPKFDAIWQQAGDGINADAILVFAPETYNAANDLNARVFVHHHGAIEDPATGSANGNLCGYLVKHRYFGTDSVDCKVEQGYEIRRPSLLMLKGRNNGDEIEVNVGGRVVLTAKGQLV